MHLDITQIILVLISFQSFLFSFILFGAKSPKQVSNRLLAVFLLVLGIQMSSIVAISFLPSSMAIENWMCVFGFNYGPLIFLYTVSLIYKGFRLKSRDALHFLPSILLIISTSLGNPLCTRYGWLIYLLLIIYVGLAIFRILNYRKTIVQTQSLRSAIDLHWLQWTMIIFTAVLIADILDQYVLSMDIFPGVSIVHLILLILVNGMFFKGIRQPQIFLGISKAEQELSRPSGNLIQENTEEVQAALLNILQYLEREQPYLDPTLSLEALANQLDMQPRRLSYIINQYLGANFMGLINSHRIEAAKQQLANPPDPKLTIQEVMYAVGFNSKSSFNTLFKKQTGMTPSEFKRKHQ